MSKLSRALGAAMLCLGLLLSASIIMAKQDQSMPAKEAQKKEQKKSDTVTISGTVSAVTDSALTIVDSEKTEHTVAITSETKVTKAGKDAALTDVKADDVATIEAKKGTDGTWMAVKIIVA
jgi:preprotein translocase subunit YajC